MATLTSTDRFEARMCQDSFYQFFLTFWSTIAAEKLVPSWYIKRFCEELQYISERVFRDDPKEYDLIWNCPPGTSKSSVLSVLWQPWIWTRMPSARFISGSYSERLALDLSRKSRDVVLSDKYQRLYPDIQLRDDQNTKGYFANKNGGIRYAVGVGGTVIGMHAHFIGIDDPIDPQAALSDLMLADSNAWMSETLSRRKVNVMLTPTALVQQRLHQDDATGNHLARGTPTKHFCLPGDDSWEIKPPELKDQYVDGLLDPIRLPQAALHEALQTLGEWGYAGQYGQNPVPRGGAMFKVDRLHYESVLPTKWKRGPYRYWDKASSLKKRSAFTVGVKVALDYEGNIWILDVERDRWDSGTRERRIIQTAKLDTKLVRVVIEQEPGSGGKDSAEATVLRLTQLGFRASVDRVTGDKELRADLFSQYVNMGKVVLLNGLWNNAFVEEMRFFPRSKYKDQMDAASGACSKTTKSHLRIGAL